MNDYNTGYLIGIIAGSVVAILLVLAFLKFSKKDGSLKCKYDERQEQVRGRGFKYGFFTLLVYEWMNIICGEMLERIVIREVVIFFGMMLGAGVYAAYAILNEGYLSLNENPRRVEIIFAILTAGNCFIGLIHIPMGDFFVDGVISYPVVNVMLGLMTLFILVLLLVKRLCMKEPGEGQENK